MKAIREAVPEVSIIADANQGWDAKSACQLIEGVQKQELNIAVLEQPVKAWDLANLKYLRDKSLIPIYADEAIFNLRDATNILHGQIADGLNLKLMKSGGIYNTRAIYDLALAYNTPCMAGCMLESPIALTAMASFVSGRKNIKFIDLDPITMLKENPVVGGVKAKDAKLTLSDKPGLGIESIANLEPILINKD